MFSVLENRAQGEPIENIRSDAMADVIVSGAGVLTSTFAAAWAGGKGGATAGSVIPVKGTIYGALGGFIGGGLAYLALDVFSPGGYTVREHVRAAARAEADYECICRSGLHFSLCCNFIFAP